MIDKIKYIVCCLVGVIILLPVQAQNIIRPKIAGPGNLWVNSYNGVLFFELTDFETQNSAMSMQLRFYYNSSANKMDYGYGLGFSLGYEMRYQEDVIGGVDIISGDGRIDHYTRYGNEYKAPAGVFNTLSRPTYNTFLLTTKVGEKYFFDNDAHHKITSFEDRFGNITEYRYQDSLLVEIKDAVGHTITLSYTDGLLSQASASFSPGKYRYEYDGLRRLRKRIDPLGNVTLYDYSHQNKINEIVDANGNKTLIAYNNAGMVSRLKTDVSDKSIRYDGDKTVFIDYTEPNNVYSYYRWDDKGRAIEKVGLCCGIQSKQRYDDDDNVVQRVDANGNITKYTYDENGNMLTLQDPLGYNEQYTYDSIFNQITSYRDKNGNTHTFSYDNKGKLTASSGPNGIKSQFTYNEYGWCTMSIDPNGGVTRTTYNSDGTTANITNPDGGIVRYFYDSYGRRISMTDPMGNTTSYCYDNMGRIIMTTDALGNITSTSYDKVGNVVRILDAGGHITAYTYDALGHMTSMTDALGNVTSYIYDGRGNVISEVNPLGISQERTYTDHNKIESVTNGEGEKTNYDYDSKGNLIAVIQPNGNIVSYEYDELDRLIEISDNMGLIAIYEYDGNGNRISETDGLDRKTSYLYDALNRKAAEILPSGSKTQYEYDLNNNIISKTDALGHVTRYVYDVMNRKVSQTDPNNATTRFVYDLNGNMTRITDAKGNVTSYSYDALNRNTAITFANGKSLQYTYDALGNLVNYKDRAGNEFIYDYNEIGNLKAKKYPDGTSDNYVYDANKRMISAINKDANVIFSYDRAGRVVYESLNGKSTVTSYDIAAGVRTLVYPSGLRIVEKLNARNLITNILQNGEEVISIFYNNIGQRTRQVFANGIATDFEYNLNGLLSSIKDNTDILNLNLSYDEIGNLIKQDNKLDSRLTEIYRYDNNSELISFSKGETNESWEYDYLGNRTLTINNGIETTYHSNNVNAYDAVSGEYNVVPSYDGNGNMIADGRHQYHYDFNNRLIGLANENIHYKYDALGRRISKGNTNYYYCLDRLIEEANDDSSINYILGNQLDELLTIKKDNEQYYYHTNHLGSTMAITDKFGNLVERVEYDPFGFPSFCDSSGNPQDKSIINNSFLFCGREYDYESSIYYMRMRSMNPFFGRFMQHDLLGYIDGMNDYLYVNNNCTVLRDPYGLTCDVGVQPKENFCNEFPEICAWGSIGLSIPSLIGATPILAGVSGIAGIFLGGYQFNGSMQSGDYLNAGLAAVGVVAGVVGVAALAAPLVGVSVTAAAGVGLVAGVVSLGASIFSAMSANTPQPSYYGPQEMQSQFYNNYNNFMNGNF